MLLTNQLLNQGRYRITQQYGQNGVGMLYDAFDNVLQSNVVIKEIIVKMGKVSPLSQQESLKLAFAEEVKALKEIKHESFLRVHDYFSEVDRHYLVMESANESNLKELLEKNGRAFSYSEVAKWTEQLLDALGYLHSQTPPLVHRDIKPQNINLAADGKIKLLSPGISKDLSERISKNETGQAAATNLHFLPLEQIWEGLDAASQKVITNSYDEKSEELLKQPTDATSDIYSLGATLYYLLTGKPPIDALERSIDILEGKADPLQSPHTVNPRVPIEISNFLMKALEIKRENRFPITSLMRQTLRTTMIRVKERVEAESKAEEEREEAEAIEALRLAEQKQIDQTRKAAEQKVLELEAEQARLEQERQAIEQKKQKLEAERRQQEELLQKEREAELKKAAAASKPPVEDVDLLLDDDILELGEKKPAPVAARNREEAKAKSASEAVSVTSVDSFERKSAPNAEIGLFAEPQEVKSGSWKIAAAAVALLVIGGGGFGIWYSQSSGSPDPAQNTPTQSVSTKEPSDSVLTETTVPETTANMTSAPVTIPSAEANTSIPITAAAKPKPTAAAPTPTPKPKKQATPPPQTAENQKKPITVDDLINDN